MMKRYTVELAPMEGITTYIYRKALNRHFGGIDVYYSPFIETHKNKEMSYKEINDIKPENNKGMNFIPQILTNDAEAFHITAKKIADYGYSSFNLNLGCPSGTVTAKNRGAGMLQNPQELDRLLDGIFSKTDYGISIKTRIGYEFESEWEDILQVYSKYPLEKLIIHPRVREDYYKGKPRLAAVKRAFDVLGDRFPIVYNGDVFSVENYQAIRSRFPDISGLMLGRGIIGNPGLGRAIGDYGLDLYKKLMFDNNQTLEDELRQEENALNSGENSYQYSKACEIEISNISAAYSLENSEFKNKFKAFHQELLEEYRAIMPGDKPVLFKMKELWSHMYTLLPNPEKSLKKIRKCETCGVYKSVVDSLI